MTKLTVDERAHYKTRLAIIAEEIDQIYAEEKKLAERLRQLRQEQRNLNLKVYAA